MHALGFSCLGYGLSCGEGRDGNSRLFFGSMSSLFWVVGRIMLLAWCILDLVYLKKRCCRGLMLDCVLAKGIGV